MEIPKWYSADVMYQLPIHRHVPFRMTKVAAEWLANEFQLAFEKGWQKAIASQQSTKPDCEKTGDK